MKKTAVKADIIEAYITEYLVEHRKSPRAVDIAEGTGIPSPTISRIINTILKPEGRVYGDLKGNLRTSKWQNMIDSCQIAPMVGDVSCGSPLLAVENITDYVPLPRQIVGEGSFFILRAKGDSMINAGINPGDYVIIRQQSTADEGDIVVALIDDEATLKRFYRTAKPNVFRLHPENEAYPDFTVENLQIQGVAVNVIKKL